MVMAAPDMNPPITECPKNFMSQPILNKPIAV
jgi:hypothetical protein